MSFRSIRIAVVALVIVLLGGWGNAARAAEGYKVQLARPSKVGDEFTTEATVFVKKGVGGNNTAFAGELHGAVKVLAVNEKTGGATKLQLTVAKLAKDGKAIYPAGAVLVAERADQNYTVTANGQPASPEAVELLRPMLGLADPSATVSDDQSIGTNQPQTVGVAWPVNKQLVARQVAENHVAAIPASVKGESKIVSVKTVDGVEAMLVRNTLSYDLPPHKNPGKVPVIGGTMNVRGEILLPVDTSKQPISMTGEEQFREIELTRHGEATISVDIQVTRHDQPKK